MVKKSVLLFSFFLILGGCASWMRDHMKSYRDAVASGNFEKAASVLEKSGLKKEKKNVLLWRLEKGTLALSSGQEDEAVGHFQFALEIIDNLYTKSVSQKVIALMLNDSEDVFYGASYERSYAHYYLAKSLYARYLKKGDRLDLQGARATILAWDTYFTNYQRSVGGTTLYATDLMLKVFGAQIHEVSDIRADKQIALQLYKDAHKILDTQGGIFSVFNKKSVDYIKHFEAKKQANPSLYLATQEKEDLQSFLHYKILSLTKEVRGASFEAEVKSLEAAPEVVKKASKGTGNVVLVFEEGFIPQKVAKKVSFGIKGAIASVDNPAAKAFIRTVGTEIITSFAMNKLGMMPPQGSGAGSFIFAHDVTRVAVQEAAITFELPMIEAVSPVKSLHIFILDENDKIVQSGPLPVVSENADLARVVLEENVVAQYVKVGTRVAIKHIIAIVSAMKVYRGLQKGKSQNDFLAKTAALATYIGATKGIEHLEKADTRYWSTLPQAFRMAEFKLKPGSYKIGVAPNSGQAIPTSPVSILGKVDVKESGKVIHHFPLSK